MDLNTDNYKDLLIYGVPNMQGQFLPVVFLSNKDGKLCYRPKMQNHVYSYHTSKTGGLGNK